MSVARSPGCLCVLALICLYPGRQTIVCNSMLAFSACVVKPLRKTTIYFFMFVSADQHCSSWKHFRKILYWEGVKLKSVNKIQVVRYGLRTKKYMTMQNNNWHRLVSLGGTEWSPKKIWRSKRKNRVWLTVDIPEQSGTDSAKMRREFTGTVTYPHSPL